MRALQPSTAYPRVGKISTTFMACPEQPNAQASFELGAAVLGLRRALETKSSSSDWLSREKVLKRKGEAITTVRIYTPSCTNAEHVPVIVSSAGGSRLVAGRPRPRLAGEDGVVMVAAVEFSSFGSS